MYNDYDSFYRPTQGSIDTPESAAQEVPAGGESPISDPQPRNNKNKKRRGLKITAIVLACVVAVGGAFGIGYAARNIFPAQQADVYVSNRQPVEVNTVAVDGTTLMSYSELYKANVNSCVSINASETQNIFGQEAIVAASSGSGFTITQDGYIATNYHVISGSNNVTVTLYDGTTYDAAVVGGDEDYDIAVLKIDAENLTPVVIGDSSELNVGDDIAVIGNPLGELTFSMSEGIVSMTNRLINVDGTPFNMIQITAAVNSGNSGGPLFNMYGEVVGIVSAKLSSSSSSTASVEGLGFAIPINDVVSMIEDIMTNGYVTNKPYLAITGGTLQPGMIPDSAVSEGVYVYSVVEGGAADKAGLQAGDIITGIGDDSISQLSDITAALRSYRAGDTVTITYYRNNQQATTELTFDSVPQENQVTQESNTTQQPSNNYNGYFNPWDYFFGGSSYNGYAGQAA